jgi:tetratricopeptide (TPR) repeat protein
VGRGHPARDGRGGRAAGPGRRRQLARRYEGRGNFTQARALWELVRRAAPDDEEAGSRLAGAPAGQAVSDEQLAAAQARLDADPTRAEGYLGLARLYRDAGRLDEARAVLSDGLPATGHAFDLTVELTDLAIEPFRLDLAATRQRLAERPGDEGLLAIEADLRREVNTRELELYRLLADRYPGRLVYRFEVGLRLLRAGQLAEAVEQLQAVRADASLEGPALLALAHGFRSRQHPRQALKHFEEALARLPPEPPDRRSEVLYELARCHAELGELPRAVSVATELVRIDPAHRDIGLLLAEWRSRAGQAQAS